MRDRLYREQLAARGQVKQPVEEAMEVVEVGREL